MCNSMGAAPSMTVSGFVGSLAEANGTYTERARDHAWVKRKPDGAPDNVVWVPGKQYRQPCYRCMVGTLKLLDTQRRVETDSAPLTLEEVLNQMRNEEDEYSDLQMLTGDGQLLCAAHCTGVVSFEFGHNYGSTSLVFTLPSQPAGPDNSSAPQNGSANRCSSNNPDAAAASDSQLRNEETPPEYRSPSEKAPRPFYDQMSPRERDLEAELTVLRGDLKGKNRQLDQTQNHVRLLQQQLYVPDLQLQLQQQSIAVRMMRRTMTYMIKGAVWPCITRWSSATRANRHTEDSIRTAAAQFFELSDTESSGYLPISQLVPVIRALKPAQEDFDLQEVIAVWDKDGDGRVREHDFVVRILELAAMVQDYPGVLAWLRVRVSELEEPAPEVSNDSEHAPDQVQHLQQQLARSRAMSTQYEMMLHSATHLRAAVQLRGQLVWLITGHRTLRHIWQWRENVASDQLAHANLCIVQVFEKYGEAKRLHNESSEQMQAAEKLRAAVQLRCQFNRIMAHSLGVAGVVWCWHHNVLYAKLSYTRDHAGRLLMTHCLRYCCAISVYIYRSLYSCCGC